MNSITRARLFLSSFVALLSSLYVCWCNLFAAKLIEDAQHGGHGGAIAILCDLVVLQWYALAVPIGFTLAILFRRIKKRKFIILVPDFINFFAIGWIFLAMFVWMAQFTLNIGDAIRK